jgi:hypothetical protein
MPNKLFAVLLLAACLGGAREAEATLLTITATGVITYGTDFAGLFGAVGQNLAGQTFMISQVINTPETVFTSNNATTQSIISFESVASATVTVGNASYSFSSNYFSEESFQTNADLGNTIIGGVGDNSGNSAEEDVEQRWGSSFISYPDINQSVFVDSNSEIAVFADFYYDSQFVFQSDTPNVPSVSDTFSASSSDTPIPEPGSLARFGLALFVLAAFRFRYGQACMGAAHAQQRFRPLPAGRGGLAIALCFLALCLAVGPLPARAAPIVLTASVGQNGTNPNSPPLPNDQESFAVNGSVDASWTGLTPDSANGPGTPISGSADASGDIRAGTLTAAATSQDAQGLGATGGGVDAQLSDMLTFNILNAGPSTVTLVTFTLDVSGVYYHAGSGSGSEEADLYVGPQSNQYMDSAVYNQNFQFNIPTYTTQTNWYSSLAVIQNQTTVQFSGTYALLGANPQLYISDDLQAVFSQGYSGSFSSTLGLQLPDGVTFTSASGNFLSAPAGAVPEPSSLALFGFSLLGIGATARSAAARSA